MKTATKVVCQGEASLPPTNGCSDAHRPGPADVTVETDTQTDSVGDKGCGSMANRRRGLPTQVKTAE